MHSFPRLLFAFVLVTGVASVQPAVRLMAAPAHGQSQEASLRPVAAIPADIPFDNEEFQTEQQLLALANQSRRQAGVPALKLDSGLSTAARVHAQTMLEARQLSHQFHGEPSLPQRLASATPPKRRTRLRRPARARTSHAFTPASREPAQPGL